MSESQADASVVEKTHRKYPTKLQLESAHATSLRTPQRHLAASMLQSLLGCHSGLNHVHPKYASVASSTHRNLEYHVWSPVVIRYQFFLQRQSRFPEPIHLQGQDRR